MNKHQFVGARWWKFDFHTHTPASHDFKDNVEPECWLKAFMAQEIDCVAITDHNSGDWIDDLKQALNHIEKTKPEWYRPLYLFPGVEISAHGDVHILAIFGCERDRSYIDQLIGAVDYPGRKGHSDTVTNKSLIEVLNEICKRGGIAIPAHVDKTKGLFQVGGPTLEQSLNNENTYAMELCEESSPKPQIYTDKKLRWTEVKGSDTHSFSDSTFGTFTWIKMDTPSIDGLELALRDGVVSVKRNMDDIPNEPPSYFVEELEISKSKHIGHTDPLRFQLSPFLNTIIGGRGSGKTTLLEFMRLVLERVKDLPDSMQQENGRYYNIEDDALLTEESRIRLIYRRHGTRYRLQWNAASPVPASLEKHEDGDWRSCRGEITSLFPAYIYSQKQIFDIANEPSALLDIIDKAPEVDWDTSDEEYKRLVGEYKKTTNELTEATRKINRENELLGKSNDLASQIKHIEGSGHEKLLQKYRKRQEQVTEFENVETQWRTMSLRLSKMKDEIAPAQFREENFSEHPDILPDLRKANEKWRGISDKLDELAQEAMLVITQWQTEKNAAVWMQGLESDMKQYESLSSELELQGIDPDKYSQLLKQREDIQKDLDSIFEFKSRAKKLEDNKKALLDQIEDNRTKLSEKRRKFLCNVLRDNPAVSIKVKTLGEDWDGVEKEMRRILNCKGRFDKDIEEFKKIYHKNWNKRIVNLKIAIQGILNGDRDAQDTRFASYLKSLTDESITDESIDNCMLWFPKDALEVTFGENRQRIEQGSPGQKTAALLAFILSYGDEPLLLDQPEDDLDNELIYNLIVEQLRKSKSRRQVIVATHNANIVVNGDAEMVLPLEMVDRETLVRHMSSIQNKQVRKAICDILEGGQQAFEQRYKRIHLGD